ncbi:adenylate kinase [Strigomonas culicis]|uniref:Adenylate kinase n=1 Tax=Strigomonas culicis TaxID=28005 RepID=S9VVL9_9TRYP|nr:adenylate kinase [Strigomonas culicis]|eukprot:EPY27420.1 adenylate kinase [Strigomonas culicis]
MARLLVEPGRNANGIEDAGDRLADLLYNAVGINASEHTLGLVVLSQGLRLLLVQLEALHAHFAAVVRALVQRLTGDVVLAGHLRGRVLLVVGAATPLVDPAAAGALEDDLVRGVEHDGGVDLLAGLVHHLGLALGAREAVEHVAVAALRLLDAVLHDAEHKFVAHEGARVHGALGADAVGRLLGDRVTQHVAGRQVAHAVAVRDKGALRALAAARRTHENNFHLSREEEEGRANKDEYG